MCRKKFTLVKIKKISSHSVMMMIAKHYLRRRSSARDRLRPSLAKCKKI